LNTRRGLLLIAAAALAGCGNYSPVSTASLHAPDRPASLVFDRDFLFTNSKPGQVQRFVGLLAGSYRATFEDDRGVYYVSQAATVVWADEPDSHRQYLAQGGVWLSKVPGQPRFKIFRVIGTELTRSIRTGELAPFQWGREADSSSAATSQFAVNQTLAGANPVTAGVGSAIGVSIAIELSKLDAGKLKFDRDDPPTNISIEGRYRVEQ
jgi:hypothetical protein